MTCMLHRATLALAVAVGRWSGDPRRRDAKSDPKPLEPAKTLKPQPGGLLRRRLRPDRRRQDASAVIRTDGATFAKVELADAATGASPDLVRPARPRPLVATDIEVLPDGKGVVVIARDKPDDAAPLYAFASTPPASRRRRSVRRSPSAVRPPTARRARSCWSAFDRKLGSKGAEATYTVTPFDLATLAPAGKPRVHKTDVAGELKTPPLRLVGFFDGYTRILAERPGEYDKKADVRAPPQDGGRSTRVTRQGHHRDRDRRHHGLGA